MRARESRRRNFMKLFGFLGSLLAASSPAGETKKGDASGTAGQGNAELRADAETDVAEAAMTLIRQRKFDPAKEMLLQSAEKGDAAADALLGQMYNAGWGVPIDYSAAFGFWSRAAAGGSTDALWGLGLLYDEGKGIAQDSKKAAELWKQGAERGNIKATVNLAFMYEEGRGVPRDLKECARLFKIAAEAGQAPAQLNYALKLLYGEGVARDEILGAAWLGVAAESPGNQKTPWSGKLTTARDRTWATLSAAEREKATRLMREIRGRMKGE